MFVGAVSCNMLPCFLQKLKISFWIILISYLFHSSAPKTVSYLLSKHTGKGILHRYGRLRLYFCRCAPKLICLTRISFLHFSMIRSYVTSNLFRTKRSFKTCCLSKRKQCMGLNLVREEPVALERLMDIMLMGMDPWLPHLAVNHLVARVQNF